MTLLLVVTGLLNFSVFVRQLRAAREQLENSTAAIGERQPAASDPTSAAGDGRLISNGRFPIVNLIYRQGAIGNRQSTSAPVGIGKVQPGAGGSGGFGDRH